MFRFPFEKVKQGSSIIIYGFGDVGREYWRQSQKDDYCTCLGFADRNYEQYTQYAIPVINPLQITSNLNFDYIVIALKGENNAEDAKKILLNNRIPDEKIIYHLEKIPTCETGMVQKILSNRGAVYQVLEDFEKNGCADREYFTPLIEELKETSEKECFVNIIYTLLSTEKLSKKEGIIFATIFREAEVLSTSYIKCLMQRMTDISEEERDAVFCFFHEVERWSVFYPTWVYDDYYTDRKKLMQQLCKSYNIQGKEKFALKRQNIKRVLIIAALYQNSDTKGAVSVVICQMANTLCDNGYEVGIVTSDTFNSWDVQYAITPVHYSKTMSFECDEINRRVTKDKVDIFYRYETTVKERLVGCIKDVITFNPDVILDLGDTQLILAPILNEIFPVLFYPMRDRAKGTFFTKTIAGNKKRTMAFNQRFNYLEENQIIEIPFAGVKDEFFCKESVTQYVKSQFNINENAFVVVTVGARLKQEVTEELLDAMKGLLERHSKIIWMLVGNMPDIDAKKYGYLLENNRIILRGYEPELGALYKISDVFLNPKREGGGLSAGIAMGNGIPVVTVKDLGSAAVLVTEQYAVDGGYPELMQYIEALYLDKELYKETSDAMRIKIREMCSTKSTQKIICGIQACYDAFIESKI